MESKFKGIGEVMKTKLEIIEELFDNGYCKDPSSRAIVDENCCYQTEDGRSCAVGKCMIEPDAHNNGTSAQGIKNLETHLKPKYRGHHVYFWQDLQDLHDYGLNWDKNSLTSRGTSRLSQLKTKWT